MNNNSNQDRLDDCLNIMNIIVMKKKYKNNIKSIIYIFI